MASVECLYLLARQSRFTWQLFYVVFCFDQHCGHAMSMVLGSPYLRRPSRIFDSRYRKIGITLYFPALLLGSMYFQLFQTKTTTIRVILIVQKFEILNFAWCQIMAIDSLISELFLFLL